MIPPKILGLHHVTAIAGDPQTNVDFYGEVLGLRLVKRTVNFEDPATYHLYYGDELARPGTILTFFPWPGARRGTRGAGQATVTAFSVPRNSLGWWQERLSAQRIINEGPFERFDDEVLTVLDPDGLRLELVAQTGATQPEGGVEGPIPSEFSIRGLHSVTLTVRSYEGTVQLLAEGLGFQPIGESDDRSRFEVPGPLDRQTLVDVVETSSGEGRVAVGTFHHVAWRTASDEEQLAWRERLLSRDLVVTPVLDRNYFHSIYFREPGGVLFEIATDSPGFTIDEPLSDLGTTLKLPAWLEGQRESIEAGLPPLRLNSR